MPSFVIPSSDILRLQAAHSQFLAFCNPLRTQARRTNPTSAVGDQSDAPFQLNVTSNLVVARVVVRDAEGKPVQGLRKEDFRPFDQGKEEKPAR